MLTDLAPSRGGEVVKIPGRICAFLLLSLLLIGFPSSNAGWLQEDVAVCTDAAVQSSPRIQSDESGNTIVAWNDFRIYDIYMQRFNSSGDAIWTADGVNASQLSGSKGSYQILPDDAGGAFISFESLTSPCTMCEAVSRLYVGKIATDGTLIWRKQAKTFHKHGWDQVDERNAKLFPDGLGGVIVIWQLAHGYECDPFCMDPPCCRGWDDYDLYAQRFDVQGNMLWDSTAVQLCLNPAPQISPEAVMIDSTIVFVWSDYRNSATGGDVFAQKMDLNGNLLWDPQGVAICGSPHDQITPQIAADGLGGVFIAWRDYRNTYPLAGGHIYMQRLDSPGHVLWPSDGIPVSTSDGVKSELLVIATGPGNAVCSWTDALNKIPVLCAQRVDSLGNPTWISNGLQLSDASKKSTNVRAVPDGAGGAVFAWEENANYGTEINLRGIWGLSSNDIYSVGDAGTILHYDGVSWSSIESGTTANLTGIWGSGSDDIYAVGDGGLMLHYDGSSWSPIATGVTANLNDIWGSSADTIYAVGSESTILRFDGANWSSTSCPTCEGANLRSVHGNAPNYYSAGTLGGLSFIGVLIRLDGTDWHCVYCVYAEYYGIWVSPDGNVYASGWHYDRYAGEHGFLVRYDGTAWINTVLPIEETGRSMWGDWSDNVYAVFDRGSIAHFDGAQWNLSRAATAPLFDIWGTSGSDVWVVGKNCLIRHLQDGHWVTQYQAHASSDIMMQRVDEFGAKLWTEYGAPATVDVDAQVAPSLACDSANVLLAWSDNRNGNWDIYARKVSIARGPLVATELLGFAVSPSIDGIRVSWQLSQFDEGASFSISRSEPASGPAWQGIAPKIERDNLTFGFSDAIAKPGASYRYQVGISDKNGRRVLFETESISMPTLPLMLYQNFPNPSNPSTTIAYFLPRKCKVSLNVYDASGRLVARLLEKEQPAGRYSVEWNGMSNSGRRTASGIYFYRLRAGKEARSRKMVLLR